MKCPKCQHFNHVAAKFCAECASPLAGTCLHCGHQLLATAKFCSECGQPTGESTSTQAPFGPPETYTPKPLAQKILNSRAALEGERKQVTVLFADLKGSMELLAERDPEEARQLLAPVLEHMMEAVHHYEGTVNQVAGDGIMALFGAPLAHEDHAVRACYAALRVQERVKRHAEDVFHARGVNLQVRVGLNSGEVVVAAIGSDLRMDYTAIGRTTHLAARMEQLANPGSILLTPSTLRLVEGFVTVKPLGRVPVKGLADPLEIYELTGIGSARTRFQAVVRRGLTRFVGREAELEQLRRAQQLGYDGHGQVVALVADAGVGKSRLVYELAHSHHLEGCLVLECGAVSYGKAMSYLPVINLLRSYFAIQDRDNLETIGDKVAAKLLALDHALEPTLPAFLTLLDVPVKDDAWETLDAGQRRRRILDALQYLLLREAREQPLLLIFEDLHWIDGETQALLDGLVESLGSGRILLVATYRPEYQHGWAGKTYYSQIRLDALAGESGGQFLDALLGDDTSLAPLKQLLGMHGNPFFLEEIVRTLVETKALEGSAGSYHLVQAIEAIRVPHTVQVMLAARIDRLSTEDKRLLQVAAVIGKRVPFSLLRAVADLPDEALRGGLDRLQPAEFIYETGLFPDLEYSFTHALTQDVAYNGMLQERRRQLHAQMVEAIETLYANRLNEQVELLAHHAHRGELREKAVSYLFQAGLKAARHSAPRNARAWLDQALVHLEALPDSQYKLEQSFDINLSMAQHVSPQKALHHLREAGASAEKLNDERRRGLVWASLASLNCLHGELSQALANCTRALTIAENIEDSALRTMTRAVLEQVDYYRGEYERVVELAIADLASKLADQVYTFSLPGPIYIRYWLVRGLTELGRFTEAAAQAHEVLRLAKPAHALSVAIAHFAAACHRFAMGDSAQARPLVERAITEYRKGNIFLPLPHAVSLSAGILAHVGEANEALSRLQEGEELLQRWTAGGTIDQAGMDYHWLGGAALLLGRLDDARRLANCSLQYSLSHRGFAAHALHLLGDIATHPDQFGAEEGETHYRKALALAEPRGMRPLIAHCHFGLSRLYQRTGKREQAREHLTTATTMYREMDMRFHLEQTEVETRLKT